MSADLQGGSPRNALRSLRRFARRTTVQERCELCSAKLAADHAHLVELASRRLVCACEACGILFNTEGVAKYRRVPRRVQLLRELHLPDIAWQGLGLPINLAFFLHSTAVGRVVAIYPSPGGATESLPPPDAWQTLVEDNPILTDLEPDVESLLVNRLGPAREYYRVGIDECYKLVGLVRTHWRSMSGGTEVWKEMGRFFADLKERAHSVGGTAHA
jgi:hypothetical protein